MAFLDMTNYISTLKYNYTVYNFHTLYELNTMLKKLCFSDLFTNGYHSWVELILHSKNAGLFEPNFGSNMDEPSHWVTFFNYIF